MVSASGSLLLLFVHSTGIHLSRSLEYTGGFPGDFITSNINLTQDNAQLTVQLAKYEVSWGSTHVPLNPFLDPMVVLRVDGNGQAVQVQVLASSLPQATSGNQPHPVCLENYLILWDTKYLEKLSNRICEQQQLDVLSYTDSVWKKFLQWVKHRLIQFQLYYVSSNLGDAVTLKLSRVPCGQTAFRCPSDEKKCVILEAICDGKPDCPQGEDEICSTDCGKPKIGPDSAQANLRIIGGIQASAYSWPWQVLISTPVALGGGSVIGPRWILTAAHVIVGGDNIAAISQGIKVTSLPQSCTVGESGDRVDDVQNVVETFIHPFYRKKWTYDFALLLLEKDLELSTEGVQAACLPRPNMGPLGGEVCYTAGCGLQNQTEDAPPIGIMRQALAPILGFQPCTKFGRPPDILCVFAGGKDGVCFGDSGGSLVCKRSYSEAGGQQWYQFGVTSFVFNGTACEKTPSGFNKVKHSMPFIVRTLYSKGFVGWFANRTVPKPVGRIIREWEDDFKIPPTFESIREGARTNVTSSPRKTTEAESLRKLSSDVALSSIRCRNHLSFCGVTLIVMAFATAARRVFLLY